MLSAYMGREVMREYPRLLANEEDRRPNVDETTAADQPQGQNPPPGVNTAQPSTAQLTERTLNIGSSSTPAVDISRTPGGACPEDKAEACRDGTDTNRRPRAQSTDNRGCNLLLSEVTAAMRMAVGIAADTPTSCPRHNWGGAFERRCREGGRATERREEPVNADGTTAGELSPREVVHDALRGTGFDDDEKSALNRGEQYRRHRLVPDDDPLQAPTTRKRHQDFVHAVQDALRQTDLPQPSTVRDAEPASNGVTESGRSQETRNAAQQLSMSIRNAARERMAHTATTDAGSEDRIEATSAVDTKSDPGETTTTETPLASPTFPSDVPATSLPPPSTVAPATDVEGGRKVVSKEKWVMYRSPEGYPYLYNPSTDESEWVTPANNDGSITEEIVRTREFEREFDGVTWATGEISDPPSEKGAERDSVGTTLSSLDISDPHARNSSGETALHMAASQRSLRGVSLLLGSGANVNATDSRGRTPLHAACENLGSLFSNEVTGRTDECVELLLSSGAREDARDTVGQTPLHLACCTGMLGAAEALVMAGATGVADNAGNTPLHLAARQGHVEIMQLLVLGNRASSLASSLSFGREREESTNVRFDEPESLTSERLTTNTAQEGTATRHGKRVPTSIHRGIEQQLQLTGNTARHAGAGWNSFQTEDGYTYYENDASAISSWDLTAMSGVDGCKENRNPSVEIMSSETEILSGTSMRRDPDSSDAQPVSVSRQKEQCEQRSAFATARAEDFEERAAAGKDNCAEFERHDAAITSMPRMPANFNGRGKGSDRHDRACADMRSWDGERSGTVLRSEGCKRRPQKGSAQGIAGEPDVWAPFVEHADTNTPNENITGQDLGEPTSDETDYMQEVDREDVAYMRNNQRSGRPASDKNKRRHGRSQTGRRRLDDAGSVAWPEPLTREDYEETVRAILVGEGKGSRKPSLAVLSRALFAACIESRPNDAAAVLSLLGSFGPGCADVLDSEERTPLHHACRRGDAVMVRLLCQAGGDPATKDCQGNKPLAVAAAVGGTACLRLLLHIGVNPNDRNDLGNTALHEAVWHGHLECVQTLVENGGRVSQRNMAGFTPRERVLKAGLPFSRGRPPRALRRTLEYVQRIEESLEATQANVERDMMRLGHVVEGTSISSQQESRQHNRVREPAAKDHSHRAYRRAEGRRGGAYSEESDRLLRRASNNGGTRTRGDLTHHLPLAEYSDSPHDNRVLVENQNDAVGAHRLPNRSSFKHSPRYHEHHPPVANGPLPRQTHAFSLETQPSHAAPRRRDAPEQRGGGPEVDAAPRNWRVLDAGALSALADSAETTTSDMEPRADTARTEAGTGTGIWGVVGRAVSVLLGSAAASSKCRDPWDTTVKTSRTRLGQGSLSSDEGVTIAVDNYPDKRRPPTDEELRAMTSVAQAWPRPSRPPSSSQEGVQEGDGFTGTSQLNVPTMDCTRHHAVEDTQCSEALDSGDRDDNHHHGMMPLSLTPMQPPPDVLAVMRQPRRRSLAPPPDVLAAMERARASRRKQGGDVRDGHSQETRGEADTRALVTADVGAGGGSTGERPSEAHPTLGPFPLGEVGELGLEGSERAGHFMYVNYLKENNRVHRTTDGGIEGDGKGRD